MHVAEELDICRKIAAYPFHQGMWKCSAIIHWNYRMEMLQIQSHLQKVLGAFLFLYFHLISGTAELLPFLMSVKCQKFFSVSSWLLLHFHIFVWLCWFMSTLVPCSAELLLKQWVYPIFDSLEWCRLCFTLVYCTTQVDWMTWFLGEAQALCFNFIQGKSYFIFHILFKNKLFCEQWN